MIGKRRRRRALLTKIHAAQQEAKGVAKSGHNKDEGFDFARFEDVLKEAKRLQGKYRLVTTSQLVDEEITLGKQACLVKTVIEYTVTDLDSGGELILRRAGTGLDAPGDKGIYKADTGTEKYFWARLFQIPFGTDPESDEPPVPDEWVEAKAGDQPPERPSADAERIRGEQDAAALAPQVPPARHERPLPESDLPEPEWERLAETREEVGADVG